MKIMIVTCVIVNYNDSETTISLLNKIKDYHILDYIVIVDNKSTDNSLENLQKYASDKVVILETEKNGGYGYGNNYGIRYSYYTLKSDYTLIVNPDVEFNESLIYSLLEILQKRKDHAIASAKCVNPNKRLTYARKYTNGINDVLSASLVLNKLLKARYYPDSYFTNNEYCYVFEVPGSLLMVKTDLMIKYGMYDEEMFLYEEEKTLGYKMKQNNLKTVLLLNQEYKHNHSVSISKSYKSHVITKKILLESRMVFLKKYRKFNRFQLFLSNVFFRYALLEMFCYSIIKKLIKLK